MIVAIEFEPGDDEIGAPYWAFSDAANPSARWGYATGSLLEVIDLARSVFGTNCGLAINIPPGPLKAQPRLV